MGRYTEHVMASYYKDLERIRTCKDEIRGFVHEPETLMDRIEKLRKDYIYSARYFLIKRCIEEESEVEQEMYEYQFSSKEFKGQRTKTYGFHVQTMEEIQLLSKLELEKYSEVLLDKILYRHPEEFASSWKKLIKKAMGLYKTSRILNREEALALAHGLKFSFDKTQDFLLRVLEDDGIGFNKSEDIVEAFCFLYGPCNSSRIAKEIKKYYDSNLKGLPKKEVFEKDTGGTQNVRDTLPGLIRTWEKDSSIYASEPMIDEQDGEHYVVLDLVRTKFQKWLLRQEDIWDVPSKSALKNYQNLILFANHNIKAMKKKTTAPSYEEMDTVREILGITTFSEEVLNTPVQIEVAINEIIEFILTKLEEYTPQQSKYKTMKYLSVNSNGEYDNTILSKRAIEILENKISVKKADLLFALWICCITQWEMNGNVDLEDRFDAFLTLADELLEDSNLPELYVPHLLEMTFLKSICPEDRKKSVLSVIRIYELLIQLGSKESGKKNKIVVQSEKEKKQIRRDRHELQEKAKTAYIKGEISLEEIDSKLGEHFLQNYQDQGRYWFKVDGIYYDSHPKQAFETALVKICDYAEDVTISRFDDSRADFSEDEIFEERYSYVYGVGLFLSDLLYDKVQYRCRFQTTCKPIPKSGTYITVVNQSFRAVEYTGAEKMILDQYLENPGVEKIYYFKPDGVYCDEKRISEYEDAAIGRLFNPISSSYALTDERTRRKTILEEIRKYLEKELGKVQYNVKIQVFDGVGKGIVKEIVQTESEIRIVSVRSEEPK